jgi:hypothetical protein
MSYSSESGTASSKGNDFPAIAYRSPFYVKRFRGDVPLRDADAVLHADIMSRSSYNKAGPQKAQIENPVGRWAYGV